jgi:hypothetical protein
MNDNRGGRGPAPLAVSGAYALEVNLPTRFKHFVLCVLLLQEEQRGLLLLLPPPVTAALPSCRRPLHTAAAMPRPSRAMLPNETIAQTIGELLRLHRIVHTLTTGAIGYSPDPPGPYFLLGSVSLQRFARARRKKVNRNVLHM